MTATLHNGAAKTVQVEEVELTSEEAQLWLELYEGPNRRISEIQVMRFQADMETGRWHFEGSPIKISRTGKLLDGQHRLTALANTVPSVRVKFLVVRGLDDDAQLYMDQGQVRTASQQLKLRGVTNTAVTAAAARLYLEWTRGRLFTTTRGATSKPEVTEWVLQHQDLIAAVFATGFTGVDAHSSVVGAFTLAILQIDPEKAKEFIGKLVSGAGLEEGDPILALDRRLRNIRRSGVRMEQRVLLAYFIKAWNAWVAGDRLQRLQINTVSEESFPELVTVVGRDGDQVTQP